MSSYKKLIAFHASQDGLKLPGSAILASIRKRFSRLAGGGKPGHRCTPSRPDAAGNVGLDIKLPALDKYLQQVKGSVPVTPVTAYLVDQLYKGQPTPQALPEALQAYITGPDAKRLDGLLPDLPPIPASNSYAHVKSRISSTRRKTRSDGPAEHTTLSKGITVFDPVALNTKSLEAQKSTKTPAPAVKKAPAKTAAKQKQGKSASRDASPAKAQAPAPAKEPDVHADAPKADLQPTSSFRRSTTNSVFSMKDMEPTPRYVLEVTRMMERVRAGEALLQKIQSAESGGKPPFGMMRAHEPQQHSQQARRRVARAEERLVQMYTEVQLPPGPQQRLHGGGKGNAGQLMQEVLQKQGLNHTPMRHILQQLDNFKGQDERLIQGLADRFTLYSYPPNSVLYSKGAQCDEIMVLLSGQLVVCGAGPPVRLHPGTVLGVQLMTERLRMPCDVKTDPHFEAHVACISWEDYHNQLGTWAANKVLGHLPNLAASVTQRLHHAIVKHFTHSILPRGRALYSQKDACSQLMLLVKGQVLVTQLEEQEMVQSEGQVVQQLQMSMGTCTTVVPREAVHATSNSHTGDASRWSRRPSRASVSHATSNDLPAAVSTAHDGPDTAHSTVPTQPTIPEEEEEEDSEAVSTDAQVGAVQGSPTTTLEHMPSLAVELKADVATAADSGGTADASQGRPVESRLRVTLQVDVALADDQQGPVSLSLSTEALPSPIRGLVSHSSQPQPVPGERANSFAFPQGGAARGSHEIRGGTIDVTEAVVGLDGPASGGGGAQDPPAVVDNNQRGQALPKGPPSVLTGLTGGRHQQVSRPSSTATSDTYKSFTGSDGPSSHYCQASTGGGSGADVSIGGSGVDTRRTSGSSALSAGAQANSHGGTNQPPGQDTEAPPGQSSQLQLEQPVVVSRRPTEADALDGCVSVVGGVASLQGMPLLNTLAAAIKNNKQRILAVYSVPVFLGEEALTADKKVEHQHTVVSTQPVQLISIPRSILCTHLPATLMDTLHQHISSAKARATLQAPQQAPRRWPEAADSLIEYLNTPAGSRPVWQVEALAEGFSSIPSIASLPWPARLRLFQELSMKQLAPHSPGMPLGHTVITVIPPPPPAAPQPLSKHPSLAPLRDTPPEHASPPTPMQTDVDAAPTASEPLQEQPQHGEAAVQDAGVEHQVLNNRSSVTSQEQHTEEGDEQHSARLSDHSQSVSDSQPSEPASIAPSGHLASEFSFGGQASLHGPGADGVQLLQALPRAGGSSPQDEAQHGSIEVSPSFGDNLGHGPELSFMVGLAHAQHADEHDHEPLHPPMQPAHHEAAEQQQLATSPGTQDDGQADESSVEQGVGTGLAEGGEQLGSQLTSPLQFSSDGQGEFGTRAQTRGLTHEVVRTPTLTATPPSDLLIKPETPGSDLVGPFDAWESLPASAIPPGYQPYDMQPHDHLAMMAANRLSSPVSTNAEGRAYTPSTVHGAASEADSPTFDQQPDLGTLDASHDSLPTPHDLAPPQAAIQTECVLSDDNMYIVVSGEAALAAVFTPEAAANPPRMSMSGRESMAGGHRHNMLLPVVLGHVHVGGTFSAPAAMQLSDQHLHSFLAPPPGGSGPAAAGGKNKATEPASGTHQVMVVQQGSQPLQLLQIRRELYALSVTGQGRHPQCEQLITCLNTCSWAAPLWEHADLSHVSHARFDHLSPQEMVAEKLLGSCYVEELTMGTELLRRQEPASSICFLLEGEAALNASHVGLADNGNVAPLRELTRLKGTGCCGELSLLASRPLWYSMVVASPRARVLSMDLKALRQFISTHMSHDGTVELLRRVAAVDLGMYAIAIHSQAQLIANGHLSLDVFSGPTRTLLQQVMDLGQLDVPHIGSAVTSSVIASSGNAVNVLGSIVVDSGTKIDDLVDDLARPTPIPANIHEYAGLTAAQAAIKHEADYRADLIQGSSVSQLPGGLPFAMTASQAALNQTVPPAPSTWPDEWQSMPPALRVAMPYASTQEDAYKRPASVRPAQRFNRITKPKMLTGAEIESNRVPEQDALPLSVLKAQQVLDLIKVAIHMKPAAGLGLQSMVGPSSIMAATDSRPGSAGGDATQAPTRQLTQQLTWRGPSLSVSTSMEHTQGLLRCATLKQTAGRGTGLAGGEPALLRAESSRVRRASESISSSMLSPVAFKGRVYRGMAPTIKHRNPRILHRNLTEARWDTSENALFELTSGKQSSRGSEEDTGGTTCSAESSELLEPVARSMSGSGGSKVNLVSSAVGLESRDESDGGQLASEHPEEGNAAQQQASDTAGDGKATDDVPQTQPEVVLEPRPPAAKSKLMQLQVRPVAISFAGVDSLSALRIPPIPGSSNLGHIHFQEQSPTPDVHEPPAQPLNNDTDAQPGGEAVAAASVQEGPLHKRTTWVRDAVHDPSGITNPLVADLMSQAVMQVLPGAGSGAAGLQVQLPPPAGGVPSPTMPQVTMALQHSGIQSTLLKAVGKLEGVVADSSRNTAVEPGQMGTVEGAVQADAVLARFQAMPPLSASILLRNRMKHAGTIKPGQQNRAVSAPAEAVRASQQQARPAGSGKAHGLGEVTVDAADLLDKDLMYVTLEVPPRVKVTPDVELPSGYKAPPPPPEYKLPAAPVQGAHVKALMVSIAAEQDGEGKGTAYVPAFLKSKRQPVQPVKASQVITKQQWALPAYSSTNGFQSGWYDEDADILYFD